MNTLIDIVKRTFYMSFFIMIIPLGAYTIHTGSSAMVAMISYLVLSILVPVAFVRSKDSSFGKGEHAIAPWLYIVGWLIVQALTYTVFPMLDLSMLWSLSTIGRDISFLCIMYVQVALSLMIAYGLSRWRGYEHAAN